MHHFTGALGILASEEDFHDLFAVGLGWDMIRDYIDAHTVT